MNAQDHYKWACDRAMEYARAGDLSNAWASFIVDISKHSDTAFIASHPLTSGEMMLPHTVDSFEHFITGFSVNKPDPCRCGCGCEPDGEWHFQEIRCACVSLACPCVIDKPA